MSQRNCAMVFAHPGHELLAAGLMQRHHPHLLFLTRADSAGDNEREALAQTGLEKLGLAKQTTFLGLGESDLYRGLLNGDAAPFLEMRQRVLTWLEAMRPALVFGDAFELSNVVHDIGRAVLDSAWREYSQKTPCDNFELPLVYRSEPELWNLRFQEFPTGPFETIRLTEAEKRLKQSLADWVCTRRVEAEMARAFFNLDTEVFRAVPSDRDYATPPDGLRFHYDDWGRYQVQLGKYSRPILFAEHFVPIVRGLPQLACQVHLA